MKTAVITGATNGIGLEIAKLLAQKNHNLILVSRNLLSLENVAAQIAKSSKAEVRVIAADLSSDEGIKVVCEELSNTNIDILINNAGRGDFGCFWDLSSKEYQTTMMLNMTALTALCNAAIPNMVRNGKGQIVNVASTAAFQPVPLMSVYAATKSYVLSLSKALSYELRKTGVTVLTLCPGATKTGFASAANAVNSNNFSEGNTASVEEVATWAVSLIANEQKGVHIHGAKNRLMAFLVSFSPSKLVMKLAENVMKPS